MTSASPNVVKAVSAKNTATNDYMSMYAQLAREAKSHGINVYGGFVRDFVVQKKPALQDHVHDLDMHTSKSETCVDFVEHLKKSYGATQFWDTNKVGAHYPFERSRWNITREAAAIVTGRPLEDFPEYINIDLVHCDVLPVNDFSANLLTWDGDNVSLEQPDPFWYDETCATKPPIFVMKDIIADIHAQVLEPFPSYLLKTSLQSGHAWFVRSERMKRFVARGWMMTDGPFGCKNRIDVLKKELASVEALASRPAQLRTLISDAQKKLADLEKKRKRADDVSEHKLGETNNNSDSGDSSISSNDKLATPTKAARSSMEHNSPAATTATTTSSDAPAVSDDQQVCVTCKEFKLASDMIQSDKNLYCNRTCYDNSTQTCYHCERAGPASTFESFFEGSSTPGDSLLYTCKDKHACNTYTRTAL